MAITFNLANLRESAAPLSHTYPREINPQPAYVELTEGGEVSADWSGEIGNSVPMYVWHNRTLRMHVAHNVNGPALADYLESAEALALLETIHAGHEVDWDGSNYVGKLSTDASEALERLEGVLREFETVEIWTATDYLFSGNTLAALWSGRALDEVVAELEKEAAINFDGVIDGSLRDALLAEAEHRFDEDGDDGLDEHHIAALIADGRITQAQADERAANITNN